MPQLRSRKVRVSREALTYVIGLSPQPMAAGMGVPSGDFSEAQGKLQREAKRKATHSLSCSSPLLLFSRVPYEQLTLPVVASVGQEEQDKTNLRFLGKRKEGKQGRRGRGNAVTANRREATLQVLDHAAADIWEKMILPVAPIGRCWEKAIGRKRGQGLLQFPSGTKLEGKLATGIEEKLTSSSSTNLRLVGPQEGLGSPGEQNRHSLMELKLQIPCSEDELMNPERTGQCFLSEPEVLVPGKDAGNLEIKGLMGLDLQIPDSEQETVILSERCQYTLGIQGEMGKLGKGSWHSFSESGVLRHKEGKDSAVGRGRCLLARVGSWRKTGGKRSRCTLSVPGPEEKVGSPEKRCRCILIEVGVSGPLGSKRSLGKRGMQSLVELKLKSPGKDRHSLTELQPQTLNLQEEPVSPGKRLSCSFQLQSSGPQKEVGSLQGRSRKKLIEVKEDSDVQDGKQLETDLNISKDCNVKKPLVAYSESLQVAKSDGAQNKVTVCQSLTRGSTVQCNRRRTRITKTGCLEDSDVKVTENKVTKTVNYKEEKCREILNHHSSLSSPAIKNPVVKLYDCRYLNTFVKSSVNATNSSYKIGGGFLHVAQGKRETFCPDNVMVQSDMISKLNHMEDQKLPTQKSISFDKEGICQNRKSYQNGSSKSLRERKWSLDRKPRKKMKLFEKSSVQNVLPVMDNKYCECELHAENKTVTTDTSAVVELNSNETISSFDQKPNSYLEQNTQEAQNCGAASDNRKMYLKPSATKESFEKRLALSETVKKEKGIFDSESIEQQNCSNTSNSPVLVTMFSDNIYDFYSDDSCQMRKRIVSNEKLISNVEKLQLYSCQRVVPMSGKNVWPRESCARTSEWFHKNYMSVSEGKTSSSGCEECSSQNNTDVVRGMILTDNPRQLDLCMTEAESIKESTCKIVVDSNIECLTSVRTPGSSLLGICRTLTCNENLKSSVNSSPSASNSESVQKAQDTICLAVKQKQDDKNKRAFMKKNRMMDLQDGLSEDDNTSKMIANCKTSVRKKTVPNTMKMLNTGNLSNFKIPLRKNKTELRKVESIRSLGKETYSPLQHLHNSAASAGQSRIKEKPSIVVSEPQSVLKGENDEMSNTDFGSSGSESLSNEIRILSEHVPRNQCAFLESELESSVLENITDSSGPAHEEKSLPLDYSSETVDHSVSSEMRGDEAKKSRMDCAQSKVKNFPDVLKAYEDDILVIDVIQDDPDLFGTTDEGELAFTVTRTTEKYCNITSTSEEKQDVKPKCLAPPQTKDPNNYFRKSPIQESGTLRSVRDSYDALLIATEIQKHDFSSGSSPLGGVTEESVEDGQLTESDEFIKDSHVDEKCRFSGKLAAIKEEKVNIHEAETSNDSKYVEFMSSELQLGLQLPSLQVNAYQEDTILKPWINDFRYSGRSSLPPLPNSDCYEPWKMDKNVVVSHLIQQNLGLIELPRKYCRLYFNTLRGCERMECWFWHVPEQGDEKICMEILKAYININESSLLQRAVQIFTNYYRQVTPGVHFDSQVLSDLLISLLKCCLLKEVFQLLNVTVIIKMLPAVDMLLKVFEHVASMNVRDAIPPLIDIFCKLFDAGMVFELEHFNCVIKFLHQLQVSSQEINVILNMKSRFQARQLKKNWLCDLNLAIAEIQHCQEKSDWAKLGTLYVNMRLGCENFGDLQKLTLYIADILTRDSKEEKPGVPFCEFAEAGKIKIKYKDLENSSRHIFSFPCPVIKNPQHNEADKDFLGRIGISVICSYHTIQQWSKGRKVLDKLHELQVHFTSLKGLTGPERLASRCQIVNAAAEIFLKSGSLDGATWVLRESEWIINTPLWPCDTMDVLNRHNLLCAIACEYLTKNLCRQAFEVLQNLPGFQNCCDSVDVSQYNLLFNKLLNACIESKNLGVSSSVTDFMLSKNIPVDVTLIRRLITALGRSSLWLKARIYYKSALSLGCYPPLEGNLYRKLLLIASYMSEIEMLLAIEIFLVSNASSIQSLGAASQTLQVVLKRSDEVQNKDDYQAAVERLIQAARISNPKLFLKHMTMNVNMEQVYSLEHNSALKWLKENMKWAGKVWLFSSH
ncbi:protein TOPAZ1 [Carettochelys insculpta]|uniref:protein TOPAZ1 n=1 Tax=Carettochelys insculpta TaxID=44489 RepID=UPI003EC0E223